MNPLRQRFEHESQNGRKWLLPYVTGGYPGVDVTIELLKRLDPDRCACAELGIPFSDPIADGPVIQTSFSRALAAGFKLDALLEGVAARRDAIRVPLVAMVSYSIVHRRGVDQFIRRTAAAGINGLIVPDLSFAEAGELAECAGRHDCPLVMIVAPTTSQDRRRAIAGLSEPFIYYQSLAGVTGERDALPADLTDAVAHLKQMAGKPVCVGFGISRPAHVARVCQVADGAIVGSAIVHRINDAVDRGDAPAAIVEQAAAFIDELAAALPKP
jgi:tryptophan synthase alpha chain